MKIFPGWILTFAIAETLLSLAQFALRKKKRSAAGRIAVIVLKAVLAAALAGLVMGGPVFLRPVQIPMVVLYAALLPDAAADAAGSLWYALRGKERAFFPIKILSLALGLAFFVYGTANMQTVTPDYRSYTSEKLTQEHRLVFVSDLHVGSAQSFETTRRTIEKIRAEDPDFVILGGDITDDYSAAEEMEETYRLFGELGVPVYYIDGNHEVVQHAEYMRNGLPYTQQELEAAITRSSVILLRDEYAEISPDLILLGREDMASKRRTAAENLENPAPEKFLLIADHQPGGIRSQLSLGPDLQISGHTHAGQLFPMRWIEALFMDVAGEYDYGDGTKLLVSAGACGWRVPFRTDARCQYEVVSLRPA